MQGSNASVSVVTALRCANEFDAGGALSRDGSIAALSIAHPPSTTMTTSLQHQHTVPHAAPTSPMAAANRPMSMTSAATTTCSTAAAAITCLTAVATTALLRMDSGMCLSALWSLDWLLYGYGIVPNVGCHSWNPLTISLDSMRASDRGLAIQ